MSFLHVLYTHKITHRTPNLLFCDILKCNIFSYFLYIHKITQRIGWLIICCILKGMFFLLYVIFTHKVCEDRIYRKGYDICTHKTWYVHTQFAKIVLYTYTCEDRCIYNTHNLRRSLYIQDLRRSLYIHTQFFVKIVYIVLNLSQR